MGPCSIANCWHNPRATQMPRLIPSLRSPIRQRRCPRQWGRRRLPGAAIAEGGAVVVEARSRSQMRNSCGGWDVQQPWKKTTNIWWSSGDQDLMWRVGYHGIMEYTYIYIYIYIYYLYKTWYLMGYIEKKLLYSIHVYIYNIIDMGLTENASKRQIQWFLFKRN